MAKKTFLADIDLALNQLLQSRLENLTTTAITALTPSAAMNGRVVYDTDVKLVKYCDGTAWQTLVLSSDSRLSDSRTPTSHIIATNTGLGPQHTISGAAAGQVLRASSATAANFQKLDHADLNGIGTNTHAQIDTHIANATIHRSIDDNAVLGNTTALFSADKILQLINTINSSVAGGLLFKGEYNAATNTPMLDATPIAGIKTGWTYVVTAAGTFFAEEVQVGDMIIAKQDTPTLSTHWTTINKNIPDIIAASESASGIIKIATTADVTTGTDDTKAVTPLKLKQALGTGVIHKYTNTIGDGTATTFTVTHNLNVTGVQVGIHRVAAPFDEVEAEVIITSVNVVTINFNVAPTAGQYRVTVIG